MKATQSLLPLCLAAALLVPATSLRADPWYQSGWVIGGAGLVAGTLIGAAITDSYHSSRADRYHRDRYHHEPRPVYHRQHGDIRTSTTSYVEETRVWPFYRKTRVYPVTHRTNYRTEAVSMGWRLYEDPAYTRTPRAPRGEEERQSVNVSIGDNNENVSITIGGESRAQEQRQPTRTITVPNHMTRPTNRAVDLQVTEEEYELIEQAHEEEQARDETRQEDAGAPAAPAEPAE